MSPTVIIFEGYRFFFYSKEGNERPHIHVKKDKCLCKYWITPKVKLAKNTKFKDYELKRIEAFVLENQKIFKERWNEYFKLGR